MRAARAAGADRLALRHPSRSTKQARWWLSRSPIPGIGIAREKQKLIFEAFQQADAGDQPQVRRHRPRPRHQPRAGAVCSAARSRLRSTPGRAAPSRSICRPCTPAARSRAAGAGAGRPAGAAGHRCPSGWSTSSPTTATACSPASRAADRRGRSALRPHPARCRPRDKGFKAMVTSRGAEALDLALAVPAGRHLARYLPARHARLDRAQPVSSTLATRHIPVQILTHGGGAPARPVARRLLLPGQADHDRGPGRRLRPHQATTSTPHTKRLLIVEDNDSSGGIVELLGHDDIEIETVGHRRARRSTRCGRTAFDCCVLDLRLPDMTASSCWSRCRRTRRSRDVPVVVFTGKELTPRGGRPAPARWPRASCSRTCSRPSGCSTRPRCSCTAWSSDLPPEKQRMLERLHGSNEVLRGRKVLVVDDDARNIFALTTRAREARHGGDQRDQRPAGDRDHRADRPT